MVAAVTRGVSSRQLAIHRTFLALDGTQKAPVDPPKMMLGPCRGCAVKLAEAGKVLMVGEGIETCLAAMQSRGLPAWAALSTSGLLALDLPPYLRDVIVLADGDEVVGRLHAVRRCAGSARGAACASLIRHWGWTSTTCFWVLRSKTRGEDSGQLRLFFEADGRPPPSVAEEIHDPLGLRKGLLRIGAAFANILERLLRSKTIALETCGRAGGGDAGRRRLTMPLQKRSTLAGAVLNRLTFWSALLRTLIFSMLRTAPLATPILRSTDIGRAGRSAARGSSVGSLGSSLKPRAVPRILTRCNQPST
jgi:hypothetical protein